MFRPRIALSSFLIGLFVAYCLVATNIPLTVARRKVLSRQTGGAQSLSQAPAFKSNELLVRFRDGVTREHKDTLAVSFGLRNAKQLRGHSGVEKLQVADPNPEFVASQLRLHPDIVFAEPNYLITKDQAPTDPSFSNQWALRNTGQYGGQFGSDTNATAAWQTTTGSSSVVVAVIDSGIDFAHSDLSDNQWTNATPGSNEDLHGWDFVTDSNVILDEQGHGTAVAGIIAAKGNNGIGISGVAWQASLMSLRVLDSTGSGDVGAAVEAIDYAGDHGAAVINLSWGTPAASAALKDAIERSIRRGVIVVCSAGNNGQDVDAAPYYPASFGLKDLIAVAATDSSDQLATWSDFGGRTVAIAAPGTNILTTQKGGGYGLVNGTSASAPLVTGVIALIRSANPLINSHVVVRAVTDSARQTSSLAGKVSSGGVVDAGAALSRLRGNPYLTGQGNGNGNSGNNGNGNNGQAHQPYVPPALRQDNEGRRGNRQDGLRVDPPAGVSGSGQSNLPNLEESRKVRTSPKTITSLPTIHSNLVCADCDLGDGGAGGSDPYFATARTNPANETGDPGVTLGSRNFNWSLPIVNLKGRAGLNVALTLYYNSLVWTKQGSSIQYNADHGTPAPGFQFGLPRLQSQYYDYDDGTYAYPLITSSGGRVQMKQTGTSGVYESSDSTYTQLSFSGSIPIVKTTDGTQYWFETQVGSEWRCTRIQDRNGNYISATYNTSNGHILTITDTLARVLNFNYDGNGNLSTITQTWNGVSRTWATFIYGTVYMSYYFPGLYPYGSVNGSYETVLSYVAFAENTSYHFDYNSYGQVYQIRHKAPDGHELEHTFYNFDLSQGQTDCPRFTDKREYAQDWNNNQEAITYYSVTNNASWTTPETGAAQLGTLAQQTAPDGTIYKEYSHTSGWDAGLTRLTEIWSGGVRKKYTSTDWTQDNTALSYPQNPRVIETNIYDDGGNRRRTTIEYNQGFSLPTHIREYSGANGQTFLRFTAIGYNGDSVYIDRRIIGLPYERLVYDGPTGNIMSRSIFLYDWADPYFSSQTPSTNYNSTNYPSSFIVGRGNMVAVFRYDCTNGTTAYDGNLAIWSERYGYNMAGSMIWSQDAANNRTNISYSDAFSDGNNSRNTLAFPTQVTDPDGYSSSVQYNYDFGAVTRTHLPTSGTGVGTNYVDEVRTYDAFGRIDRATNQTNNAYARFVYEANANYVHTYQTVIDLTTANEFHSWQVFDGAGRVRAAAADHPGSAGGYTGQLATYDNIGRITQQTNPTEVNADWIPIGDDVYVSATQGGWRATQQTYDWQGRPVLTTNTDGTQRLITYGGCGCAGGEVATVQDEHGRQRRLMKDTLGRLGTVEELNWSGSVYSTTSYAYNVRDQITQINQAGQIRSFDYDGHARLWHKITPEQGMTTYSYNADDTAASVTDARGATATYNYNAEHQITSINYGTPAGVAATAAVYFAYDAAGHRTSMTDGMGSVSYGYNNLGQMSSETRSFNGVGSFGLSYSYNLAGELASITNPWGSVVSYSYDKAGRLNGVGGSGAVSNSYYASSINYRAFGPIKGMNFGDGKSLSTAYDVRMRPTTWNVSGVLGYNYNYDYFNEHTGRVTYAGSLNDATLDRSYEYDNVGRLAISHSGAEARAAAYSGQWGTLDGPYSQGYDYDVFGNVTHKYGWGGEVQGGGAGQSSDIWYSHTNNRRNGFSYDASGNLTNDIGQAFTYDATGQQTASTYTNLQNYYDGEGLRVKRTQDGSYPALYLRSTVLGGQIVAEIDYINGSWQWQRGYVYQGSQLLAVQQAGAVYWMHEDPVTKSKRVTDVNGNIVSTVEPDPWGAYTNRYSNGSFQPREFTSYERDANRSDEAMFRRYNRWHSRFDQPDPYDGSYELGDPQSFNRYAYVQGDPVNFVDPSGLDDDCPDCINTPGDAPIIRINADGRRWSNDPTLGAMLAAVTGGGINWAIRLRITEGEARHGGGGVEPQESRPQPLVVTAQQLACVASVLARHGGRELLNLLKQQGLTAAVGGAALGSRFLVSHAFAGRIAAGTLSQMGIEAYTRVHTLGTATTWITAGAVAVVHWYPKLIKENFNNKVEGLRALKNCFD
ncbi:MAG: S8 family serine peptidase [Pyrinomonadaceae bacterium]